MASASVMYFFPLLFFAFSSASAQSFYVAAPNTIRLGEQETVAVAHDHPISQRVTLFLQDHPKKTKRFANLQFEVPPDKAEIVRIQVRPGDLPKDMFTDPKVKNYVVLVVQSGNFNKELIIPITSKSGYIFVQTDKPIYTPKQRVHMRIIPLTEKTLPSDKEFKLQIRNPQNIVVKEEDFNNNPDLNRKAFVSHDFQLPPVPLLGEWSISALYGSQFQHNSSVKFEVREYVLPTFSLKLEAPEVVLPNDKDIRGKVTATFVYGKKVEGYATFKFGVKSETGTVVYFGLKKSVKLADGAADFRVSTDELKNHKRIGWFPQISGNSFVVEVTVTDSASGNQEVILDDKGRFSESPFVISFKPCLKDFKPGLVSVVEADITYINGRPADGVPTTITAVADGNVQLNVKIPESVSDENGRVTFLIHPEVQHTTVTATLRTNAPNLGANQATASHTQQSFVSRNRGYIAISRRIGKTLIPLYVFVEDIFMEPPEISDVYYMVVSRGAIVLMNKLPKGNFKTQKVEFQMTYDMVPSFRLIVFAHHRDELIADSLKVDVSDMCSQNAQVTIEPNFPVGEPGSNGKIIIRGSKNTLVGLLAVDEAVYALRNKDLLTKSKMFKTMESHDLGCGPGGGRSTEAVLGNAGIAMMTNVFSPPQGQVIVPACEEKTRRKREIVSEMSQNYTGREKECCQLGIMRHHSELNCFDRAAIVERMESANSTDNCTAAFLECCSKNEERKEAIINGSSESDIRERDKGNAVDKLDFIDIENEARFEENVKVRSDFRETWIFDDKTIGPDNKEEMAVSLPHSITTWVIQAVSVSNQYGMCVAEPTKVVAFQKVFLQLNLPYSVVRNEQIEIQAVVFNYGIRKLPMVVYMHGVKDICSGAQEGEKSERQSIFVEPKSATSVSFPIIPLKTGEFNIKVTALSPEGSDIIIRKLNVVPEGYPVEKSIVVKLDPMNRQNRRAGQIATAFYSDSIDQSKKLQNTAIKLSVPEEFIPDTESCAISAIGTEFGPAVETSLQGTEWLISLPTGCCGQTMSRMGPTLYSVQYLKDTRKLTRQMEATGYNFIRQGYQHVLRFRKGDGSYAPYPGRPSSVWLTAHVMKLFCQASALVHIDQQVICSGLRWLVNWQQADGSFIDQHPAVGRYIMGGVVGTPPMTAFVLIALEECNCASLNLGVAKARARSFLETQLGGLREPLPIAFAAYALALSNSRLKDAAFGKLQAIERYNADLNTLHWVTGKGTQDIEVTSYALLTYLLRNDMIKSGSIVNWFNTQIGGTGGFRSTQDTVMALQALSKYAIKEPAPGGMNLMCDITSTNEKQLQRRMVFNEDNALVPQHMKVDKVGGMLFVKTQGHGVGLLSVKLKYNIPTPPEMLCKFETKITVTEVKAKPQQREQPVGRAFVFLEDDVIRAVGVDDIDEDALNRSKRENNQRNGKLVLKIQICTKYLNDKPTGMAIVDAGIFSGFVPVRGDLEKLVKSSDHLIDMYEKTSRSIVFYLDEIPTEDYCFDFRINREFIVGNTQMSVLRVYDYYTPEESCTIFYSPDENSPMLRKICKDGICQCAEVGCPSRKPFAKVSAIQDAIAEMNEKTARARGDLINMACNENDYVWKGKPIEITRSGDGYLRVRFQTDVVLKEGIEKSGTLTGKTRELLARDNCESAELSTEEQYLIMGKDGEQYLDDNGKLWYRYLLDRSTAIHKWVSVKAAEDKFLQSAVNFVAKKLRDDGCLD